MGPNRPSPRDASGKDKPPSGHPPAPPPHPPTTSAAAVSSPSDGKNTSKKATTTAPAQQDPSKVPSSSRTRAQQSHATRVNGTDSLEESYRESEATREFNIRSHQLFHEAFGTRFHRAKPYRRMPRYNTSEEFAYFAKKNFDRSIVGRYYEDTFPAPLSSSGSSNNASHFSVPSIARFPRRDRSFVQQESAPPLSEDSLSFEEWHRQLLECFDTSISAPMTSTPTAPRRQQPNHSNAPNDLAEGSEAGIATAEDRGTDSSVVVGGPSGSDANNDVAEKSRSDASTIPSTEAPPPSPSISDKIAMLARELAGTSINDNSDDASSDDGLNDPTLYNFGRMRLVDYTASTSTASTPPSPTPRATEAKPVEKPSTPKDAVPTDRESSYDGALDLTQYNIPLLPMHPNADPEPTLYNFAKNIINSRRSTSAPPTIRPPAPSATATRSRPNQSSNASARVEPRNLHDELTSYNVQNDAFKDAVATTSNVLQRNPEFIYVDPMSPLNETNEPSTSTARKVLTSESMDFEDGDPEASMNDESNPSVAPINNAQSPASSGETEDQTTLIFPWFFHEPSPEAMDIDQVFETTEVEKVSEAMEVDQVPKEYRLENDTDFEMTDESFVSTQSAGNIIPSTNMETSENVPSELVHQAAFVEPSQITIAPRIVVEAHGIPEINTINTLIDSNSMILPSSSTNTNPAIEKMDVAPVTAPEEEERLVANKDHSEVAAEPSSIVIQPAPLVDLPPTAETSVQDPNPPPVLGSSSSADQGNTSPAKPASKNSQDVDSQEKPSRERLNDIVSHHRRRPMFPTVRFSPGHSVMKRRSNTVQQSRLALVCHINRRRNQQMMQIKPYSAIVEKPVIEVAAHHQRRREMQAASQISPQYSRPRPTTTGRSRLALIEANRARTQPTPTLIAEHPSAVNAEVPKTAMASTVVAAEPVSSASASHRDQTNDVPSGLASSQQIGSANIGETSERTVEPPQEQLAESSLPQRKFRSSHLERAFAKQRRQAPITRQELEDILVRIEAANRNQHPDTAVPTSPRRPFETRTKRIWDGMKDDGRPIRRAIHRPQQFYSNEDSFVKRKQEGVACQGNTSAAADIQRPPTPREIAIESRHQPAEASDDVLQELDATSEVEEVVEAPEDAGRPSAIGDANAIMEQPREAHEEVAAAINVEQNAVENVQQDRQAEEDQGEREGRTIRRYSRGTRRNFHRLQYDADGENETSTSNSNKKAEKSRKKGVRTCNHPHVADLPHLCNHDNAEIMRVIARRFVMCRLCGMPIAPRLITSTDNELTESDDEHESDVDDPHEAVGEVEHAPEVQQEDQIERDSDGSASNGAEQEPEAPIEEIMVVEDGAENATDDEAIPNAVVDAVPVPPQVEAIPVDREVSEPPANDMHDDIPGLDYMSGPEGSSSARSSPSSRKRHRSNTTDREPSVESPRRDVSPPGDSSHNEEPSEGSSDGSSDGEAPPPPRRRRRVNRGEWGQLRHIIDLEGADLPDAPPFVARQREVYGDISLAATEQIQVVRGIDFVAALYRSGLVVYQGEYRGAHTGAAIFREARYQPVLLWQDIENRIVQIEAGDDHLVMRSISGEVFTIGRSEEGQLGIPDLRHFRQSVVTPASMLRVIHNAAGQDVFVTDIRARGNVTEVKTHDGTVYRCGDGVLEFAEFHH